MPISDGWHRLPVEVREIILKMTLDSSQKAYIRNYPFLDPRLRTWMLTKDTLSQASLVFHRYTKFFFAYPFTVQHPMMYAMTKVTIDCEFNSGWFEDSIQCECEQSLVEDPLVWFMWLRHCTALQKLAITTGIHQRISTNTLKSMPFFELPSSLREITVSYDGSVECDGDQHMRMYQQGKDTYKSLTNFLAIRLSSWIRQVNHGEVEKTVFRPQSNKETH
jgi:hypothetical protein